MVADKAGAAHRAAVTDRQRAGAGMAYIEIAAIGPGRASAIHRRGAGRAGIAADNADSHCSPRRRSGWSACRCLNGRQRNCSYWSRRARAIDRRRAGRAGLVADKGKDAVHRAAVLDRQRAGAGNADPKAG